MKVIQRGEQKFAIEFFLYLFFEFFYADFDQIFVIVLMKK